MFSLLFLYFAGMFQQLIEQVCYQHALIIVLFCIIDKHSHCSTYTFITTIICIIRKPDNCENP
jgi:hypothetical protein